jgi:hypothetical protein
MLIERLRHYFTTYKRISGQDPARIAATYSRDHAFAVVQAALADYEDLARSDDRSGGDAR